VLTRFFKSGLTRTLISTLPSFLPTGLKCVPLDTMGSKGMVVSDKLHKDQTKGEAYVFRNDHRKSVYCKSFAPLHGL